MNRTNNNRPKRYGCKFFADSRSLYQCYELDKANYRESRQEASIMKQSLEIKGNKFLEEVLCKYHQ